MNLKLVCGRMEHGKPIKERMCVFNPNRVWAKIVYGAKKVNGDSTIKMRDEG